MSRYAIFGVLLVVSFTFGCRPAGPAGGDPPPTEEPNVESIPAPEPAEPDPVPAGEVVRSAVVHDGHLLSLYGDEKVAAWDLNTGEHAPGVSAQYTDDGLLLLAAAGGTLWAADDDAVYKWTGGTKTWEKVGSYESAESPVALVAVGGKPLLVFPSRLVDPVAGKTYPAPKLEGYAELQGPPFNILATHGTDTMLWVGTGKGEWGGALLGLDPATGKWVSHDDGLGYVTGITDRTPGEVVVAWSMSHFGASTRVRVHRADATTAEDRPRLEDKYYQRLAYNRFDSTLYAVENNHLVTVTDGKPTNVAKLVGRLYERERNAIGSAPGLLAVIPVGPKAVAVVPKRGDPWLVRDGKVTTLKKP